MACGVLHNICLRAQVQFLEDIENDSDDSDDSDGENDVNGEAVNYQNARDGVTLRENIIQRFN